jgi:hypothetical protein
MYAARLVILSFLILVIMVAYTPQARGVMSQAWVEARPGVVALMDDLYTTIRNFVAGSDLHNGIDDNAPGVDFERIITMEHGGFIDFSPVFVLK